jgi:hypothetical protein
VGEVSRVQAELGGKPAVGPSTQAQTTATHAVFGPSRRHTPTGSLSLGLDNELAGEVLAGPTKHGAPLTPQPVAPAKSSTQATKPPVTNERKLLMPCTVGRRLPRKRWPIAISSMILLWRKQPVAVRYRSQVANLQVALRSLDAALRDANNGCWRASPMRLLLNRRLPARRLLQPANSRVMMNSISCQKPVLA